MVQCLRARNERFLWRSGGPAYSQSISSMVLHRRHVLFVNGGVSDPYRVMEGVADNWKAPMFSVFRSQPVAGASPPVSPVLQMRSHQIFGVRTLSPAPILGRACSKLWRNLFSDPLRFFSSTPFKQEKEDGTTDGAAVQPHSAPSAMPPAPGANSVDPNVANNTSSVRGDGFCHEEDSSLTQETQMKALEPTLRGAATRSNNCSSELQDIRTVSSEPPKHLIGSSSAFRHATRLAFASIPGGAYAVMQQQYSLTRHLAQRYAAWKTRWRLLKEKKAAMKGANGVDVSSTSTKTGITEQQEGRNSEPLQQHWTAHGRRSTRKRSRLTQRQPSRDIQGTPILTSPPVKVLPHLVSETVLQSQRAQQKFQQTGGSPGTSSSAALTSSDLPPLSSKALRKEYSDGASTQRAPTSQTGSQSASPFLSTPQTGVPLRKGKDDEDLVSKSTTPPSETTSTTPAPSKPSPAITLHVVDDAPELMRHYEAVLQTILAAGTVEKREKHFLAEYRKRCHITEDMHLEALKRLGWERAEFEAGTLFSHAQKQPYWRQLLMRGLDICEEKGNYIVTLGSVASLTSIMMPNMLHLRCLQIIAGSLHFLFNVTRRPPLTSAAYWNLVFFVINGFMLLKLFLEHRPETFSESELDMFERYFLNTGLSPRQFKKLLSLATWKTIPANEVLVEQGQPVTQLCILYRGQLKVLVNGSEVETLREGDSNAIIGLKCFLSRLYENSTPLVSDGRDDNGAQQQLQQGMLRSLLGIAPVESGDERGDTLSVEEATLSKPSVNAEKDEKFSPPQLEGQVRQLLVSTANSEVPKAAEQEAMSQASAVPGTSPSSTQKEKMSIPHSREPGLRERTMTSAATLNGGKTALALPTGMQENTETNKASLASSASPWGDSKTMASSTTVIATEDAILLVWSMDDLLSRVKADPVNIGFPLVGGMARSLVARSRNQSAKQNLTSYQAVMQAILSDGEARPEEKTFLHECRQKFGIPEEHHWIILERLGWTREEFEDGAKRGVVRQPATRAIRALLSVVKEQLKRAGTNGIQLTQPENTADQPPASVQP